MQTCWWPLSDHWSVTFVLSVTFWTLTYYKIWILLIIYCFIWNYWIIYFVTAHLTSLVWVCVVWRPESLMKLSALCLQRILHAAISFGQIIHTSSAAILYANLRQLPKQEQNRVHLPLNHVDSLDIQQGYPGFFALTRAIFSAVKRITDRIPSLFHMLN